MIQQTEICRQCKLYKQKFVQYKFLALMYIDKDLCGLIRFYCTWIQWREAVQKVNSEFHWNYKAVEHSCSKHGCEVIQHRKGCIQSNCRHLNSAEPDSCDLYIFRLTSAMDWVSDCPPRYAWSDSTSRKRHFLYLSL